MEYILILLVGTFVALLWSKKISRIKNAMSFHSH